VGLDEAGLHKLSKPGRPWRVMRSSLAGALVLLGVWIGGCIGSTDDPLIGTSTAEAMATASWARAIPATITGLEPVALTPVADQADSGAGIWVDGDLAYVSGLNSGFHVIDVSKPDAPKVVGQISGDDVYSRDADLIQYPDGTKVVVLATQSGGMTFVDVSDPTMPEILSIVDINPNHNLAVVPGTHVVYNSPSNGAGNPNEIVDASDPRDPKVVGEFGDHGCHDTSFYVDETQGKARAYCAGVAASEIWDIADPLKPQLIATVSNPCMDRTVRGSNCRGLHHSAFVNDDATILMLGDEFMGGGGPGCQAHVETGDGSVSSPIGALWFYDLTDEANPELLGWFAPTIPLERHLAAVLGVDPTNPAGAARGVSCTSHFGQAVPGHDLVVMGWYNAGVLLIDFSDPAEPRQVDQWLGGGSAWDARIHNGYIFTGDINYGLEVLTFAGG